MNFQDNLERAKQRELYVGSQLQEFFGASGLYQTTGKTSAYDISFLKNDKTYTVEIKSDYWTTTTHSKVCFEVFNSRTSEPAGICATEANYFCFDLPKLGIACFFETSKLQQLLFKNIGSYPRKEAMGDGNAIGYIVPLAITGQLPCKVVKYE